MLLFLLATAPMIVVASPAPIQAAPSGLVRPVSPRAFSTGVYDVDVRLGSTPLWSGQMRVSDGNGASFNQEKTDGSTVDCTPEQRGGGQDRSSFTIRLNPRGYTDRSIMQLAVTVVRPGTATRCEDQGSTRTLGLTQVFAIEPGQDVRIAGDSGLAVRLHRR
jgi:hypothetical protein